jgi:hypothetical protein
MDSDHQPQIPRRTRPQHTEHGYGTYEWDPQRGVAFRMDLDQFGTVGGVQLSQHVPRTAATSPSSRSLTARSLTDSEVSAPGLAPTHSGRMLR